MKTKYILKGIMLLLLGGLLVACSPEEDNDYKLGGSQVAIPQDWNVTAADNDNEVVINFDPLTIIDGEKVLGVQFTCTKAGINFTVKDQTTTELKQKVYVGGDYILYVAAITRAGAGVPREVSFTVAKNLLLETLGVEVLPEVVVIDNETFNRGELYIESNSIITLSGDLASDDAIVNLDFFDRESTSTVKFIGASGVYALYWNPVRKNVIIEPTTAIESPNYFVLTGVGLGYPTSVSSEVIIAAYGDGDGRYSTWWDPGSSIRSRIVMRSVGADTYQATVCINEGATFKPFSNTDWGDDSYAADKCTFTGSAILKESGDWSPNENSDKDAYYRITLTTTSKLVNIKKVSATGEVLPDEQVTPPVIPTGPIQSENFDLTTAALTYIDGEMFQTILQSLEKDAEYTLKGGLADANIVYNLDFFERVSNSKVKFLGETGDYTLYYNPIRKNMIVGTANPRYPDYLVACGFGLGYPTKATSAVIDAIYTGRGRTTTDWNTDAVSHFMLFRNVGNNVFQATVYMPGDHDDYLDFKPFENTNDWWDGGKDGHDFTFTGVDVIDVQSEGNWGIKVGAEHANYRITIDLDANTVNIVKVTL